MKPATVTTNSGQTIEIFKKRPVPEALYRNKMLLLLLRNLVWVNAGHCIIEIKDVKRDRESDSDTKKIGPLVPNYAQLLIARKALLQAIRRQPIRQTIPKSRQVGASTWWLQVGVFWCKIDEHIKVRVYGHEEDDTEVIFQKAKLTYEECTPNAKLQKKQEDKKTITPPGTRSVMTCQTAVGRATGRGGSPDFALFTEIAHYPSGSGKDRLNVNGIENALSKSPNSIIIMESTGNGDIGIWPDRVNASYAKKGRYDCVFIRWTEDPNNESDPDEVPEEFDPPLSGDEVMLMDRYKATREKLYWRRLQMDDQFPGTPYSKTPSEFKWEFPLEVQDCFAMPTGRIFPQFSIETHVRRKVRGDFGKKCRLCRLTDWGNTAEHKYATLWIYYDPDMPPGFSVDPSCEVTIKELSNYVYKANSNKKDTPIEKDDDTVDALRQSLMTMDAVGHVHVYRELVISDFTDEEATSPEGIYRQILHLSGWVHPSDQLSNPKKHPDYEKCSKFYSTPASEIIDADYVDPNRQENIRLWRIYSMKNAAMRITPNTIPERSSPATYWIDGITKMRFLMSGGAVLREVEPDPELELLESAKAKMNPNGPGRRQPLTPEERRVYERYIKAKPVGRNQKNTSALLCAAPQTRLTAASIR